MWFIALHAEISGQRWSKSEQRADHQDQGKVQVKLLTFDLDACSPDHGGGRVDVSNKNLDLTSSRTMVKKLC